MEVAWFMHEHPGRGNTLVGVWPTKIGVYVRSWVGRSCVIKFYPMQPAPRVVDTIAVYSGTILEEQISADVLDDLRSRSDKTR